MNHQYARPFLAVLAAATLPLAAACSKIEEGETPPSDGKQTEVSQSLASALGEAENLGSLNQALATADLSTVFDGPGSYTLLAPTDDAFAELGEQGDALMKEEQRPLLVAILRDHILPGHLTIEAIEKAIADQGGPVTVTTLGDGRVTFAQEGETISVTNEHGSKAMFTSTGTAATNGVILPIDSVLMPPKEA